jgi:hypothetical protein
MQVRLDQLDARGLELRLGDTVRAVLGEMTTLRGELIQEGARTVVERAAATRAEVAALHLGFGETVIGSDASIVFDELRGSFRHDAPGDARGELQATRAEAFRLQLSIGLPDGPLTIAGRVLLTDARLRLDGASGAVFAEKLTLADVAVERAGMKLDVESLEGVHVAVEWSPAGVRVRASSATLGAASAAATIPAPAPIECGASAGPVATEPAVPLPPAVQALLPLLDGLAGQLDVDLGLDLTVPVLGRRRATHKFRIPIESGALDYLKLENDLSTLEDALLDFAMRDGGLVLEMGIPFVPTRGKGKPILRWDVEGDDLVLARKDRIRLAMLPQFRMAAEDSGDGGSGKSRVALRELSLRNLEGKLRLEHDVPPAALPLRRVGELAVRADLHHAVETRPRDGTAGARIAGVELGAMSIVLGIMSLGFRALTVTTADIDAELAGLQPRGVRARIQGLRIAELDLAPRGPSA